jgi:dihydrodipicolinate synthase/N-acetylneuraminate lyase
VAPSLCVAVYEAAKRGDHEKAWSAQRRLNQVRLSLALGTAPGGVKAALNLVGMSIGPSRSPIAPLSPDKLDRMRRALTEAGLEITQK